MKPQKYIVLILLLVAFTVTLSAPQAFAAGKHKLRIAQTLYPSPSAHMNAVEGIAAEVKEKSNGRIKFRIYGPELGDWAELNEMVNRGAIST